MTFYMNINVYIHTLNTAYL